MAASKPASYLKEWSTGRVALVKENFTKVKEATQNVACKVIDSMNWRSAGVGASRPTIGLEVYISLPWLMVSISGSPQHKIVGKFTTTVDNAERTSDRRIVGSSDRDALRCPCLAKDKDNDEVEAKAKAVSQIRI